MNTKKREKMNELITARTKTATGIFRIKVRKTGIPKMLIKIYFRVVFPSLPSVIKWLELKSRPRNYTFLRNPFQLQIRKIIPCTNKKKDTNQLFFRRTTEIGIQMEDGIVHNDENKGSTGSRKTSGVMGQVLLG